MLQATDLQADLFQDSFVIPPPGKQDVIPATRLAPGVVYLTHYGPRVITTVGEEEDSGKRWLIWRWRRAPRSDGIDCGYGGVLADAADTHMVQIKPS